MSIWLIGSEMRLFGWLNASDDLFEKIAVHEMQHRQLASLSVCLDLHIQCAKTAKNNRNVPEAISLNPELRLAQRHSDSNRRPSDYKSAA